MTLVRSLGLGRNRVPPAKSGAGGLSHLAPLDGIRGLAILMVLVHHMMDMPYASTPGQHAVERFLSSLWCGVDLFFVLSGFLITRILLAAKAERHYFRNFYARRTLRIFPLYYLALTVVMLMALAKRHVDTNAAAILHNHLWLWTYTANVKMFLTNGWSFSWVGHFWSLCVEEHFYLVWPALVFLLSRRRLAALCVAMVAGVPLLRWWMVAHGHGGVGVYVFTPFRADALALGGLLAIAWCDPRYKNLAARFAPYVLVGGLAGLVALYVKVGGLLELDPLVQTAGYTLSAGTAAGLIAWTLGSQDGSPLKRAATLGFLRTLGTYSYGLYVCHDIFLIFLRNHNPVYLWLFRRNDQIAAAVANFLAAGTVTFALAFGSYHLWEKRFLRLKRYFV